MTGALQSDCPLCREAGGHLVHRAKDWRVVRVTDTPAHPAFYRVIWNDHVREFSQLPQQSRLECMNTVVAVEQVLMECCAPRKINVASLGNQVAHLHWHVIARFDDDAHFPSPVWAAALRDGEVSAARLAQILPGLDQSVRAALAALPA